jgi:uncharacterized protein YndB with AHSA1/START domain
MVASSGTAKVTLPADTQILITREFDAPKELIWKAWTTPDLVRQWWHANRGEVTVSEIDLRVGGKWRSVMVTTEGGIEVAFHGEYREIEPYDRLVSTEAYEGIPNPDENATVNTVTLEETDGRTLVSVLVDAPSKEVRDAIIESGMEAGMQDAYDLLEQVAISLR